MIFLDTSAFLAILSSSDVNHQNALLCWRSLLEEGCPLITNNYIIVESMAIIQKRHGLEKIRDFKTKILPLLQTEWVDEEQHIIAVQNVLSNNRRRLSPIDCSAFESMRRQGIETVFTFDEHFREQGFKVMP